MKAKESHPCVETTASLGVCVLRFSYTYFCAAEGTEGRRLPLSSRELAAIKQRHLRILLVDDRPDFRESFAERLETVYEAVVERAAYASEAIDAIAKGCDFDLILMDVSMPGLPGNIACERILADRPDLHIALMSANSENQYEAIRLNVPFLPKPVEDAILGAILLNCIEER